MSTAPVVRLHLFFATENDRAVILRQGPTRQFRMILWHRDTDTFEDGQWLRQKIYLDWCDLSPDGRHFLYYTLDGKWSNDTEGAYTVLSRPPYFTALSLFPEGNAWGGGGQFLDNAFFVAIGGPDIRGGTSGLARMVVGEPTETCSHGIFDDKGNCARIGNAKAARLREIWTRGRDGQTGGLDHYDTVGGRLYRRNGLELDLIRDFTDMTFEPVRAPYDTRPNRDEPAAPAPWHPLKGES